MFITTLTHRGQGGDLRRIRGSSMNENQNGFKSLVYRENVKMERHTPKIREQKHHAPFLSARGAAIEQALSYYGHCTFLPTNSREIHTCGLQTQVHIGNLLNPACGGLSNGVRPFSSFPCQGVSQCGVGFGEWEVGSKADWGWNVFPHSGVADLEGGRMLFG